MNCTTHHTLRIALLGLAFVWAGCGDTGRDRSIVGSEDPVRQLAAKGAVNAAPGRYIVVLEDGVSASEVGPRSRCASQRAARTCIQPRSECFFAQWTFAGCGR